MRHNDIFGIRRSTILIISVALAIGSFSTWKALGGGTTEVAGTLRVPSALVVAGLPTEPHSSTVRSPAARTTSNFGSAILTKADADAAHHPSSVMAGLPTEPPRAVRTTLTPIEQIQVGDRVLAESPTGEEDAAFASEISPSDWRKLTLRAPKRDGTVAEVVLLRPLTWLNEQHGEVSGTVFISVPECGIDGNANVLAIDPCPEIHSGSGRVVTGTFLHQARSTITLTIAGQTEPIECTGNHPFWSEDRQTFVRADSLQPNETLRTSTGLTTVESWTADLNPTPVYNIEVHGAHLYHIGTTGVVVHNGNADDCWTTLYRVVGKEEWLKIESTGRFDFPSWGDTPTGEPGKFFWGSMSEAESFQKMWYLGGETSYIVKTVVPSDPRIWRYGDIADGIGDSYFVPMELLSGLIKRIK